MELTSWLAVKLNKPASSSSRSLSLYRTKAINFYIKNADIGLVMVNN